MAKARRKTPSTEDTKYKLPSKQEIMQRLVRFQKNELLLAHFYPHIANNEGKEVNATELAEMFILAAQKFVSHNEPPVNRIFLQRVPLYIAVVVTDQVIAKAVTSRWDKFVKDQKPA